MEANEATTQQVEFARKIARQLYPATGFGIAYDAALAAVMETQRLDAELASLYIINGNSIHPDIPAENMARDAKMIAHTTCQHISEAIRTGEHYALAGGGRG